MISLRHWNSYLKMLYESPNVMDNTQNLFIEEETLNLEDTRFGVKQLAKEKLRTTKATKLKS